MPYALEFEVPGDEALYERVKDAIGDDHPPGLLVHMVVKTAGGLRHIEVWNSLDEHERFHHERVDPAVHAVLQSIGSTEPPPPHDHDELDLIDLQLTPPVATS
jgi:hypothetical protein